MGTAKQLGSRSLQIRGASLLDLFETSALAVLRAEYDTSLVGFEREIQVSASAPDLEHLLQAWLDQIASIRHQEDFVVGDVIVVEVGRPPGQRYGDTSLACRGAARGRTTGAWFDPPSRTLEGVVAGSARVEQRRRDLEATFELRWVM